MSLNGIFATYVEFDIFRNVGLIHQGIYYLKVRLQSELNDRIMSYKSNPCIKSNFCDNRHIHDAVNYYKPCSVDIESNSFISRSMLIRYQGEEASMRDSCCWRIEVPFHFIENSSVVFTVDLYSHQPIKGESNRVIAYSEKATFIESQQISISNICDQSDIHYVRLLFSEQGLCEVRGLVQCSFVDIRYHQHNPHFLSEFQHLQHSKQSTSLSMHSINPPSSLRLGEYLSFGCDNFREVEERYTNLTKQIIEYFETSYYQIVNFIQSITIQFPYLTATIQECKPFSTPLIQYPF